jgi:Zn-finger nucleic acid-binding protein
MSATIMQCTCSGHARLLPVMLTEGLQASQCEACEGTLLPLDGYRAWRDSEASHVHTLPELVIHGLITVEDSPSARACPQCERLMQRLRVQTDEPDFRIDRCSSCQLVWFDRGEWAALAHNGLARQLDEVMADAWQRQLRQDELRAGREAALRIRHGDACMDELCRIKTWLDAQPAREELLALLGAEW